jgi:OOP family OmpA-OmpF porin
MLRTLAEGSMKVHVHLGLGLLLAASPAAANVEVGASVGAHKFSVNNELGVADSNQATSVRDSVLFALRLGYGFTPMLGAEVEVGVIPTEARALVFDVWTLTFRAHAIATFGADDPAKRAIPFAVVGIGAITVTQSDNTSVIYEDTDEMFYLGGGLKYRADNGWGLRADARLIAVPSSELTESDESVPLGLDAELLLSVYKEFGRPAPARPEPVAVSNDADGDTILDEADQCVNQPEDLDGFEDVEGCPDPDNDGDGVLDPQDDCDSEPEDADGFADEDGCPDADNDGDGLLDDKDGCRDEAEDPDGHQDEDGCPDPDNDGDGVPDASDQCPEQQESANGYQDDDGCPDDVPKAIKQFTGVIKGITFKVDSDVINKASFKVLDKALAILLEYTELKLEIQGHTDDTGDADYNRDLSQRRAESVKSYFVGKGVDAARLVAKGYGPDAPLVAKKTKAARAKNRRVEFKLISDLEPTGSQ